MRRASRPNAGRGAPASHLLTPRWYPLRPHAEQYRLYNHPARFKVVPPGRRSGKSELAKRYTVEDTVLHPDQTDGWRVFAAPTHAQAKRIYWRDLKALIPNRLKSKVSESELTVTVPWGAEISVLGMDVPERIEGRPLHGIVLDEFANMKPSVWEENVRPALDTDGVNGWAWLIGVPEVTGVHYKRLFDLASTGQLGPDWATFHWPSWTVLDAKVIEAARRSMDQRTFDQEYGGLFVSASGRAYYAFHRDVHARRLLYDPDLPLDLGLDFNVEPGVATISQEQSQDIERAAGRLYPGVEERFTAVIGEVHIPRDSTTRKVIRRFIRDWGDHEGIVRVFADSTGGARSASSESTNLQQVRAMLVAHFGEDRIEWHVPTENPAELDRVVVMNSRIESAYGEIRMLVDPVACPRLIEDLEGVTLKPADKANGKVEIDKKRDLALTHLSDALGYVVYWLHREMVEAGLEGRAMVHF